METFGLSHALYYEGIENTGAKWMKTEDFC